MLQTTARLPAVAFLIKETSRAEGAEIQRKNSFKQQRASMYFHANCSAS